MKLSRPSEHDEQRLLCQWLDLYGITYCAVPNAGKRSYRTAAKLKAEGLRPGFPDLLIFDAPPVDGTDQRHWIRGVAIELKRSNGGKVRAEQTEWLDRLGKLGWATSVCYGADDAIARLGALGYGARP